MSGGNCRGRGRIYSEGSYVVLDSAGKGDVTTRMQLPDGDIQREGVESSEQWTRGDEHVTGGWRSQRASVGARGRPRALKDEQPWLTLGLLPADGRAGDPEQLPRQKHDLQHLRPRVQMALPAGAPSADAHRGEALPVPPLPLPRHPARVPQPTHPHGPPGVPDAAPAPVLRGAGGRAGQVSSIRFLLL